MKIKVILFILLISVLAFLSSCTLEEPVLPSWISQWSIPFNDSYSMEDIAKEENIIADTTDAGVPILAISMKDSTEKKTITIHDLSIKPELDYTGKNIDDLSLGTIGPESSSPFGPSEILGMTPPVGVPFTVRDTVVTVNLVYILYANFNHADIKSGTLELVYKNNTFLDIRSGMEITIYNDSTGQDLGTAVFPNPIAALDSGVSVPSLDLSGTKIHKRFLLEIRMPLAAKTVTLSNEDLAGMAWVDGTLIELKVSSGEANFPPQHVSVQDSTSITGEEHQIRSAEIARGKIELNLENNLEVTARGWVRMLNFVHRTTGQVLSDYVVIPAKSTTPKTISLQNYRITDYPDRNSGEFIDYINFEVNVVTDSSQEFVHLSDNDSVKVEIIPDSLFFSQIDGRVDSIEVVLDPVEKDDLGELSKIDGTISMDSLRMAVNLYNESNLPIEVTLFISGSDADESIEVNPVKIDVPRADDGGMATVVLSVRDPHPNIVDLMAILPTSIRLEGKAYINGEGSAEVGQSIYADYQIYSPLFLWIKETAFLESEMMEEDLDEDMRDKIKNNVQQAVVSFNVLNGLPISSEVALYVSADTTGLFDDVIVDSTRKFIIPDLKVDAAVLGSDGYVDYESETELSINLSKEQLALFYTYEKLYIGLKTALGRTDGLVKFRSDDSIQVDGAFNFQFIMNKSDDSNFSL